MSKKEEYQKKFPVKVWLEMPEVWRTEAEYWKYLRGQFRRIWKDFPTKNKFKAMQMIPNFEGSGITNPRVKKVAQCNYCKDWFTGNNLQVDHVSPVGSFKNYDDAAVFLYRLLAPMDNMQLLCADKCHLQKSYAERMGMSMEDAIIEKQCVAFGKLPAAEQSAKFMEIGLKPEDYSTKEKRRDAYREYLKQQRDAEKHNAPTETINC